MHNKKYIYRCALCQSSEPDKNITNSKKKLAINVLHEIKAQKSLLICLYIFLFTRMQFLKIECLAIVGTSFEN